MITDIRGGLGRRPGQRVRRGWGRPRVGWLVRGESAAMQT
jgi:hypothetical protein